MVTMCSSSSVTLVCAGLALFLVGLCKAGCREAGLCCTGRDPSCISKEWRSDRSYGTCYCDQACVSTLDCCHDYETACPAVSCVVSEWTQWSGCAVPCRAAVHRRNRKILQKPLNAAKACAHLEERAGCAEYWTEEGRCYNSLAPALITTSGYGNARKKRDLPENTDVTGYCVQFQLTSLTKECQQNVGPHTQWMKYLREGHHVCVECQAPALAAGQRRCTGDGEKIYDNNEDSRQSLQWQAVGNPRCRGVWRRVERLEACSCPTAHSFLFI